MFRPFTMATMALILATGCGMLNKERKPEDRLENASTELDKATREREEARQEVAAAQDRLSRETTDVAITRSIQQKLLADTDLAEQAVQAQVSQGNVRLTGTVKNEQQKRKALQIAAGTPGVAGVTDEIRISDADPQSEQVPRQD
jgi:hyperosmotically inducible protein